MPTVVELDARGGDVAWRYGLTADPGLRSLAAASRLRPDASLLAGHARPVGGSAVPTLTAPVEPDAARQAVAALMPLLDTLRTLPDPVLLDLGAVDPKDPGAVDLLADLSALLVVARTVPEQVARLNAAAPELQRVCRDVKGLFIGNVGEPEVAAQSALPVAGVLPLIDPDAGLAARLMRRRRNKAFGAVAVRLAAELEVLTRRSDPNSVVAAGTRSSGVSR
jgi:hypothetical protein